MLIDWVSASISRDFFSHEQWAILELLTDKVQRLCPSTGEIRWTTAAWDSVRSDSHQVMLQVTGTHLRMQGSPARVCGDGDTVFSSGASRALDLEGCVDRMANLVGSIAGFKLPVHPKQWKVTRIDVTGNLRMDDLESVRSALTILRNCEGGRYRVSQTSGDTVYWGGKSGYRRGKAYAKGPHLKYLMDKVKTYTGRDYTANEIIQSNNLLRLELTLGRKFFAEKDTPWWEMTNGELTELWEEYFGQMIGDADMSDDNNLKENIIQHGKTEGQGKAAYAMWLLIKNEGWENARALTNKATWYRNLKTLKNAGLGDADISVGNVVMLRRRILDAQLVESWAELAA